MFGCQNCNKSFSTKDNLARHVKFIHDELELLCEFCGRTATNLRNLKVHQAKAHNIRLTFTKSNKRSINDAMDGAVNKKRKYSANEESLITKSEESVICETCNIEVSKKIMHNHLKSIDHKNKMLKSFDSDENIQVCESAFKSRIISYRVSDKLTEHICLKEFINSIRMKINNLLKIQIATHNAVKTNFELFVMYTKDDLKNEDGTGVSSIKSFNTKNRVLTEASDLNLVIDEMSNALQSKSEDFQGKESGWGIQKILFLEININKYNPMRGSSYIPLPEKIHRKHAVLNIENNDQECFYWCIMAALNPEVKKPHRVSELKKCKSQLVLSDIRFPVTLNQISLFEKQNNLSINVYGVDNNNDIVGPLYYTNSKKLTHINLLYLENGDKTHFCLIKNLSRLISSQLSKMKCKKWICDGCLTFFRDEQNLIAHTTYGCNRVKALLPTADKSTLQFKNYDHSLRVPYIIYCDFEAILKPIDTCLPNLQNSFTTNIVMHEPSSFAYYIKCAYDDNKSKFATYRGTDCGKIFVQKLKNDLTHIYNDLHTIISMKKLTKVEQEQYDKAKNCHICKDIINAEDNYKVRDHCHLTGKFRGAAHVKCNLNYKLADFVPLVCHNLSGYDAHFIIKELDFDTESIDLIAQNKERYISFTKHFKIDENRKIKLRFIDSFKFMATSIDKLSKNLIDDQFKEVRKAFPDTNEFNLIKRKGVFPYEYLDSFDRFNDPELPPLSSFFNKLNNTHINNKEFNHAKNVWKTFKCSNLGEYSDLYLKSDVLILADIFENFRNVCLKTYDLDPAHYFTAPGLSWDAMLKYTKIKMDLLTDIDIINFINKGVRGGLAQCSKRYSKANHKYMKTYNQTLESQFIIYLDANNLYGWAMSQYLPYANFKWLSSDEVNNFDISSTSDTADKGYILEVDIDYPENLHEIHDSLPFLMENREPLYETSKQTKLIANLLPKRNYVIHQKNLKQCLSKGLLLTKIHRVLEFSQKPWLKPYIDLNTDLRANAKNSFDKDFYKLMNNSVFGKTLEDVAKRKDIRLLTHWEDIGNKFGANRLISKPNFHSSSVFKEDLVAVQMNRLAITYNKPIYVGFCVLELSKTLMYDFHYDYIKPKYGDNATLLYTDTDSFVYEIKTEDFFEDIRSDIDDKFDTSDYHTENIYNLPLKNKKVLGKFKDECCGKIITEFLGLKAKTYCIVLEENNDTIKKIKGIKKNVVSDTISFNDYKNCLNQNEKIIRSQQNFRSIKHNLYTQLTNKLALSNFDDKRFVIPNSNHCTLAWGNKKIDEFYFI